MRRKDAVVMGSLLLLVGVAGGLDLGNRGSLALAGVLCVAGVVYMAVDWARVSRL